MDDNGASRAFPRLICSRVVSSSAHTLRRRIWSAEPYTMPLHPWRPGLAQRCRVARTKCHRRRQTDSHCPACGALPRTAFRCAAVRVSEGAMGAGACTVSTCPNYITTNRPEAASSPVLQRSHGYLGLAGPASAYTESSVESPSSFMAPFFQNGTCSPFQPPDEACSLGNLVAYSINASSASDIAAGIRFAKDNNIRLVIKNTGHE